MGLLEGLGRNILKMEIQRILDRRNEGVITWVSKYVFFINLVRESVEFLLRRTEDVKSNYQ